MARTRYARPGVIIVCQAIRQIELTILRVLLMFMVLHYFGIRIVIQYSGLKHMAKPSVSSKKSSSVITNTIEDVCLQKKRDRSKVFEIVSRVISKDSPNIQLMQFSLHK